MHFLGWGIEVRDMLVEWGYAEIHFFGFDFISIMIDFLLYVMIGLQFILVLLIIRDEINERKKD